MTILRQRMIEELQMRNLSPHTQIAYVQQISRFSRYFAKSPDQLGPDEIRAYQIYLTNERKLSPASIQIAVCALCFFYKVTLKRDWCFEDVLPRPKKPQRLPIVLSPEEVVHFLSCVESRKHRVILTTCYAAGLRISEAVGLKPAAIDSQRMVIRVEQGKNQKCAVKHYWFYVFAQFMLPWRQNARSSSVAAALGGNITLAFDFVRALLGIR
jgi:integrase/recombinase XerD